jgi:beta-1,4-N-acetylglucosaminyltransferase
MNEYFAVLGLIGLIISFIVGSLMILRWRPDLSPTKRVVLAVLGSGGHTTEILYLIKSLEERSDRIRYVFVVAGSDHTSVSRITGILGPEFPLDCEIITIRRIRHVGESFFKAVLRVPPILLETALMLRRVRPNLILANGPGTCVPVILLSWLFSQRSCVSIFVESFCRVKSISLSGRLVYRFVDIFFVQWPLPDVVRSHYPKATYLGGPLVL